MVKKEINPTDKFVGMRVRMRRMMLGYSQEKLGDALGLTFQQVQKYEKGTNRIGASRLQQIAQILEVPAAFFFDGLEESDAEQFGFSEPNESNMLNELLATSDGLQLNRSFMKIKDSKIRRKIVELVETIANTEDVA